MLMNQKGSILTVDIHGLNSNDAKRQLEQLLSRTGKDVHEVVVIHGYSHGQALKNMVRFQLKHPRIQSKLISLNEGQTRLLLKER
ncbi:Smr/MutS family protein [Faecalispora anaeroviscerum]|uniref:Smr/MutS family protein n=1 Tax=Faecalispora anaeroviscerum TaxID=2991836 RepID=UPI0024B923E8|nr:Smr/MutS family protein [Faecalispora anaeroviscerum]